MVQEISYILVSVIRRIMPALIFLSLLSMQSCTSHRYHRADRPSVASFLDQLNKQFPDDEEELSSFTKKGEVITIAQLTGSTKLHSLWIADVNNDGVEEYLWTYEAEGFSHHDAFVVFHKKDDGTFMEIEFPLEGKDYPSNIADPLVVYEDGKTYLALLNIWAENGDGEPVYSGANSIAAPGAEYLVTEELQYYWDRNGLKLVSREKERKRLVDE